MFNIKFKDFKLFVARLERISICLKETMQYENFICLKDVPGSYDEYYVYGIGSIESEFYQISKYEYSANHGDGELVLLPCIEIVLSEKPREL